MIVSPDSKHMFIDIPRTGSTSIRHMLRSRYGWIKHAGKHANKRVNNNIIKFCFVRNPWDRAVSWYKYRKTRYVAFDCSKGSSTGRSFKQWLMDPIYGAYSKRGYGMGVDQCSWIDNRSINYIGRFEKYNDDLRNIMKLLGLQPPKKILHLNSSTHRHYLDYYDDESYEHVKQHSCKDVSRFGYK
jgi:hypothetical protein